jgi:hypothetical protein
MNNSSEYRTSSFLNETNKNIKQITIDITSNSYEDNTPYGTVLPSNINVFSSLAARLLTIENQDVIQQVKQTLLYIYRALQKANVQRKINNYLSRINLVQQQDMAALLEWNFENFRVGFTLEPNRDESSYYIISQDNSIEAFQVDTQKINPDFSRPVEKIVKYVLENT